MEYQENQNNYLLQRLRNGNNTTISCTVVSSIPCEICSSKCWHLVSQLLKEEQVFCNKSHCWSVPGTHPLQAPLPMHYRTDVGKNVSHCSPCLVSTEKSYIIVMLVPQGTIPVLDTTSVSAKIRFTSSLLSSKGSELL